MVNDMMRAHLLAPYFGFRPRGGRNNGQISQRTGELDSDRANAASAANNQDSGCRAGHRIVHSETIKEHFIRGQRGQRHRRCLSRRKRFRRARDNPLIYEMEFSIRSGPVNRARIPDHVTELEISDAFTQLHNLASRIPP